MRSALDRLCFEAGAAAANSKSAAHRISAAREVSQFDLVDLTSGGEARGHLALAIREAVLSLALIGDAAARLAAAEGIRALVRAVRAEPHGERADKSEPSTNLPKVDQASPPPSTKRRTADASEPRRYWVDQ